MKDQPDPHNEEPPKDGRLQLNINGMENGTVQIDFPTPITRLSLQPDEAIGLCMAVLHATTAILQNQKKDAQRGEPQR